MNDMRLPAVTAANEAPAGNPAAADATNAAGEFDAVMSRYAGTPAKPAARDAQPVAQAADHEGEQAAAAVAAAVLDAAAWVAAATAPGQPNAAAPPAAVTANIVTAADVDDGAAAADARVEPAPITPATAGKARGIDMAAARTERAPAQDAAAPQRAAAAASPRVDAHAGLAATARTLHVPRDAAPEAAAAAQAQPPAPTASAAAAPTALPLGVGGATTSAATYSLAHAAVAAPVAGPAFAPEFAQRVVLFARGKLQHAEIAVTPAELGPISVSIEVRGQEAALAFAAPSHATRAAIEEALPRLRELLAAHGLQLTGAEVNDQPRREYARGAPFARARHDAPGAQHVAIERSAGAPRRRVGLIDIVV